MESLNCFATATRLDSMTYSRTQSRVCTCSTNAVFTVGRQQPQPQGEDTADVEAVLQQNESLLGPQVLKLT